MKTCFLIGHRDAPFMVREKLENAIAAAIVEYGVTEFVVGQYGAFDKMAASCLAEAKKAHPEIRLVLLLPYYPSARAFVLPAGFDGSLYPPGMEAVPRRLAIVRSVDVAGYLGYSKACVCVAVKQMIQEGLVLVERHGSLMLTEESSRRAQAHLERCDFFRTLLLESGVEAEAARQEADAITRAMSGASFEALRRYLSDRGVTIGA